MTIVSANCIDNDGDGINDAWEQAYNFSTTNASQPSNTTNSDTDTVSDWMEGIQGTNPYSRDFFRISQTTVSGPNLILTINTFAGNNYSIDGTQNMTNINWQKLFYFEGNASGIRTFISVPFDVYSYFRVGAHACAPIPEKIVRNFSNSQVIVNQTLNVSLNVTIGNSSFYIIDELIPAGWLIVDLGGADNSQAGHLKWVVISGANNITYEYILRAPNVTGLHFWNGSYAFEYDPTERIIIGPTSVNVTQSSGSDSNPTESSTEELMSYISRWKANSEDVSLESLMQLITTWKKGSV